MLQNKIANTAEYTAAVARLSNDFATVVKAIRPCDLTMNPLIYPDGQAESFIPFGTPRETTVLCSLLRPKTCDNAGKRRRGHISSATGLAL